MLGDANAGSNKGGEKPVEAALLPDAARDLLGEKSVFEDMQNFAAAARQTTEKTATANGTLPNNFDQLHSTCAQAQAFENTIGQV